MYLTYATQATVISDSAYINTLMSVERRNPLKRDQALNDATSGQIGEEPRPEPSKPSSSADNDDIDEQRLKAARKMSRDL
jgi:hypothetical protein